MENVHSRHATLADVTVSIVIQSRDLVERVNAEPFWFLSRDFADLFVRREATECLQPVRKFENVCEDFEVYVQLITPVVVVTLHYRFLDRAVHAFKPAMLHRGFNLVSRFSSSSVPWMISRCISPE